MHKKYLLDSLIQKIFSDLGLYNSFMHE